MKNAVFLALAALGLLPALHAEPARVGSRDHVRNARYGEIVVVTGGPFRFTGHVYNTLGLNDCPEALWKTLDPKRLKKELKARSVILNGPRYFLMDKISLVNPGNIASFEGLQARHLADVKISLLSVLRGRAKPYTENTVVRTTDYVFRKGRPIYELVAPDGTVYVMQSYSLIVDPTLKESELPGLAQKLKLPPGWQYRVRRPESDLVLKATGVAHVLQDNLQNSYQREN